MRSMGASKHLLVVARSNITTVFLDSRYALSGRSLQIPVGILLEPGNRRGLGAFSKVASWSAIDATNNILYVIIEQTGAVVKSRAISLTTGPHDSDSLAAEMQVALSGAGIWNVHSHSHEQ